MSQGSQRKSLGPGVLGLDRTTVASTEAWMLKDAGCAGVPKNESNSFGEDS